MPENIASCASRRNTASSLDDGVVVTKEALQISSPIGLIAGGGVMPFAVADSLIARGIDPILFALRGSCDPVKVTRFRYHWISIGQISRLTRLMRSENC